MTAVVVGAVLGLAGGLSAIMRQRRRSASWRANSSTDGEPATVTLVAGPWAGKVVTVPGLPAAGAALTYWKTGLVGAGVNDGYYVVRDVNPAARSAQAYWELDAPD